MADLAGDKGKLLQAVIREIEGTLRRLGSGYASARQATLDSPHVMKSKREVAGIEASYLANGLAGTIREREHDLRILRALQLPEAPRHAALGCLVGLGPSDGPLRQLYFILPVCGGMELPSEDGRLPVRILTPGTPVAKALIGKAPGDPIALPAGSEQELWLRLLA